MLLFLLEQTGFDIRQRKEDFQVQKMNFYKHNSMPKIVEYPFTPG